jgi:hypothetical protein
LEQEGPARDLKSARRLLVRVSSGSKDCVVVPIFSDDAQRLSGETA